MDKKTDNGLFLPNRQLSLVVAGSLLAFFLVFIAGYVVGQRMLMEQLVGEMDQDSLAAQIYTSLYTTGEYQEYGTETTLHEKRITEGKQSVSTEHEHDKANKPRTDLVSAVQSNDLQIPQECSTREDEMGVTSAGEFVQAHETLSRASIPKVSGDLPVQKAEVNTFLVANDASGTDHKSTNVSTSDDVTPGVSKQQEQDNSDNTRKHYAQLIGFGTKKYAQRFIDRLQQRNEPVELKKRVSTTARGAQRTWYQAVTKPFADKQALQVLVDRIKKEEKLRDIRIVSFC